jgi:hypothetical protein
MNTLQDRFQALVLSSADTVVEQGMLTPAAWAIWYGGVRALSTVLCAATHKCMRSRAVFRQVHAP